LPLLPTIIMVTCPQTKKEVNVKEVCEGLPRCPYLKHFAWRGSHAYLVCDFGGSPREEPAESPSDPELEEQEGGDYE